MTSRRVRPFAVAVFAATVACAFGGTLPAAGASARPGAERPQPRPFVPSQPETNGDLIYEAGAPTHASPSPADRAALLALGRQLYDTHCTTCHGANLAGGGSVPSLLHAGGASVDFFLTTGRMPDASKTGQAVHAQPHFDPEQIRALDAYVTARATSGMPVPRVVLDDARLQRGRVLFEANCEACHGAAAEGATVGTGWIALPLYMATSTQVGEAIRIGPGLMPRFTPSELSADDVDAIATYVHYLTFDVPSYGGLTLQHLGPAAEGLVGAILGVGSLFWVIFFTGTKVDRTRLHERE